MIFLKIKLHVFDCNGVHLCETCWYPFDPVLGSNNISNTISHTFQSKYSDMFYLKRQVVEYWKVFGNTLGKY